MFRYLLLFSIVIQASSGCVFVSSPINSRLDCEVLQNFITLFQPYLGQQIPLKDVQMIVQDAYDLEGSQIGTNESETGGWNIWWQVNTVGVRMISDKDGKFVSISTGFLSHAETTFHNVITGEELSQCIGAEPEWFESYTYPHFEGGTAYELTLYYEKQGVIADKGWILSGYIPPPITSGMQFDSVILVQPGSIDDVYCRAWNNDLGSSSLARRQIRPWAGWENAKFSQDSPSPRNMSPKCKS